MDAFSWLGEIFNAALSFVPRRVIVRATHGGVKWTYRGRVKQLKPGMRWYWPLTTDIELVPVARQTIKTLPQALLTEDGQQVVVGGVVVYSIYNVVKAIGKRNYDVDSTVDDISQAAIVEVVTALDFEELLNLKGAEESLTETCRRQLRQYGVYVHRAALTDFSTCFSLNLMGLQFPGIPDG